MRSRNIRHIATLCLLGILFATAADAATGDTVISIKYKVRAVRIKPQPHAGGVGEGSLLAILRADGKVNDIVEGKAGGKTKQWGLKQRRLGSHKDKSAQWRVIDANTLERRYADRSFDYLVKVVVDGKTCRADVVYTLHPGQKEYITHSVQLNQIAHYSELKPFDVQCKIE